MATVIIIRDNRGKTDKLDARNIALYAMKHHDELGMGKTEKTGCPLAANA